MGSRWGLPHRGDRRLTCTARDRQGEPDGRKLRAAAACITDGGGVRKCDGRGDLQRCAVVRKVRAGRRARRTGIPVDLISSLISCHAADIRPRKRDTRPKSYILTAPTARAHADFDCEDANMFMSSPGCIFRYTGENVGSRSRSASWSARILRRRWREFAI